MVVKKKSTVSSKNGISRKLTLKFREGVYGVGGGVGIGGGGGRVGDGGVGCRESGNFREVSEMFLRIFREIPRKFSRNFRWSENEKMILLNGKIKF